MSEPFVVRNHLSIAAVAGLQMVVPALIAVALLYITLDLYRIPFDQNYHSMAALVALSTVASGTPR